MIPTDASVPQGLRRVIVEGCVAVFRELGRTGASPHLVLAMAREAGALVGHAWVEDDGQALLEHHDPRAHYVSLVEYDANGARVSD